MSNFGTVTDNSTPRREESRANAPTSKFSVSISVVAALAISAVLPVANSQTLASTASFSLGFDLPGRAWQAPM
jgi:hypothetical protein